MCADHKSHNLCCLVYAHSSLELRPPVPLRGRAGRGCRESQNPPGRGSWSGGSSAPAQRSEKCCPRAEFWTNPFQGMHRKLQEVTGRVLAADVVATRSDRELCSCGESRWPRLTLSKEILPWANGMPRCSCRGRTGYQGALRTSDSHLPSPRVLCSWKAFPQPARADQCVPVPIPQTSREVTSPRHAAVTSLLPMQKHYLLVNCYTAQERIFRLAYFTSFGLISLCIITVLNCLVLEASVYCAWDLPQCCLQRWPTPCHPRSPHCAQLFPLEQADSVSPGTLIRHGQFWTSSACQFRHVYLPT